MRRAWVRVRVRGHMARRGVRTSKCRLRPPRSSRAPPPALTFFCMRSRMTTNECLLANSLVPLFTTFSSVSAESTNSSTSMASPATLTLVFLVRLPWMMMCWRICARAGAR